MPDFKSLAAPPPHNPPAFAYLAEVPPRTVPNIDLPGWHWGTPLEDSTYRKQWGWVGKHYKIIWWHNGWCHISLGLHVHLGRPWNIEVHLPGGFLKIAVNPP